MFIVKQLSTDLMRC